MGSPTRIADPFAWVGATLDGKYYVERVVGEGGFGVVYRATHLTLREPVAVKCLKLGANVTGPVRERFLENFLNEGKLLLRLSSVTTGIVQARDAGAAVSPSGQWSPYLVLEWLEGLTLAQDIGERVARGLGGRSLAEAVDVLQPAVNALDVALRVERVAHRDLKPENLFLTRVGNAWALKVLDFGIAKVMSDAGPLTAASAVTGLAPRAFSIAYGAPEQFEPVLGATGPWTDVYALALVLLEVVSGRQAYVGTSREERHDQAINPELRPSFAALGVAVPESVDVVMRRALAVDPRNRYQTAADFWNELRAAHNERPRGALPTWSFTEPASDRKPRPVLAAAAVPLRQPGVTTSPVVVHPQQPMHRQRNKPPVKPKTALPWILGVISVGLLTAVGAAFFGVRLLHANRNADAGMAKISEGRYVVGNVTGDAKNCESQATVYLLPFLIDQTEVTLGDYKKCENAGKCSATIATALAQEKTYSGGLCNELRAQRGEHVDDNPMNCVDRQQAKSYCAFVGKRLPTDDEWEAAARGSAGKEYPWGNDEPTCDKAIFGRPPGTLCLGKGTAPVRSTPANTFGVYDLAGNVWEWTSTSCPSAIPYGEHERSSPDAIPDVVQPTVRARDREEAEIARLTQQLEDEQGGPQPKTGTLRGGGWEWRPEFLRSWKHLPWRPNQAGVSTGFRCAKDEK